MRIDDRYLNDPTIGDLHVVEGIAFVHLRDDKGELQYVDDPTNGQRRPLVRYVNVQSLPNGGAQPLPYEDKSDTQLTGVSLTKEEMDKIKPLTQVAENLYKRWFVLTPEEAQTNREAELKSQDEAIRNLIGLGFENKTAVGPASHVFVQEVDENGEMAPYGLSCDRIIMDDGGALGLLRYVFLDRKVGDVVRVGRKQQLKVVAVLDSVG